MGRRLRPERRSWYVVEIWLNSMTPTATPEANFTGYLMKDGRPALFATRDTAELRGAESIEGRPDLRFQVSETDSPNRRPDRTI